MRARHLLEQVTSFALMSGSEVRKWHALAEGSDVHTIKIQMFLGRCTDVRWLLRGQSTYIGPYKWHNVPLLCIHFNN